MTIENRMVWDNDQQQYRGTVNDQASGYLIEVAVSGDEFAESLQELGQEAEGMLIQANTW